MIKLNELKPFNILTDPAFNNQMVILTRINIHDGNEGRVDEGGYAYDVDLRTLDAVPLSPEILEKIGMKKRFEDMETCNIWDMKEQPTRNKVFSLAYVQDEGWIYMACPGAVGFHSLHQLQNLYYALTQTELSISL